MKPNSVSAFPRKKFRLAAKLGSAENQIRLFAFQRLLLWGDIMSFPSMSKEFQAHLKRRSLKISRLAMCAGKSSNEIAAGFSANKDQFLSSREWKIIRRKVIETYGARCMKCFAVPRDLRQINVDHIKPRKHYPNLAMAFENLQVLCCACNKAKGNKDETDYRPK